MKLIKLVLLTLSVLACDKTTHAELMTTGNNITNIEVNKENKTVIELHKDITVNTGLNLDKTLAELNGTEASNIPKVRKVTPVDNDSLEKKAKAEVRTGNNITKEQNAGTTTVTTASQVMKVLNEAGTVDIKVPANNITDNLGKVPEKYIESKTSVPILSSTQSSNNNNTDKTLKTNTKNNTEVVTKQDNAATTTTTATTTIATTKATEAVNTNNTKVTTTIPILATNSTTVKVSTAVTTPATSVAKNNNSSVLSNNTSTASSIATSTTTLTTTVSTTTTVTTTTTTTTTTPKPKKPPITYSIQDFPDLEKDNPDLKNLLQSSDLKKLPLGDGPYAQPSQEFNNSSFHRGRDFILPIVSMIFIIPLVIGILITSYRRFRDCWSTRHYRRMDFLVDGMYND